MRTAVVLAMILVSGVFLPLGCGGGGKEREEDPVKKNLLLITIDTLRADHLNCYGYRKRMTSPRLDRFAKQGALFERTLAAAPWTIASTATLLTGLDPFHHGFVFANKAPLSKNARTAAEILTDAGYKTGAFSANLLIQRESGFGQGFEDFEAITFADARIVNAKALSWLEENSAVPFFLYLHYFDPHDPYEDPDGFYKKFDPDYPGSVTGDIAEIEGIVQAGEDPGLSARDIEHLLARYDGEIAFVDQELGKLFDWLDQRGLAEMTVVCVVSDHGEQFFEHGAIKHGATVHQEELWVPWLLRAPGQVPAGLRVERPVRHADVLPVCLRLLGIEPSADMDGTAFDVQELMADRSREESIVCSQTNHGILKIEGEMQSPLEILTAVSRHWKLIRFPSGAESLHPIEGKFDDAVVLEEDEVVRRRLGDELSRWAESTRGREIENTPYSPEERARIEKMMMQALEDLGYLRGKTKMREEKCPHCSFLNQRPVDEKQGYECAGCEQR